MASTEGTPAAGFQSGLSTLTTVRDLVQPQLRVAVERLDPRSASIAGYHFGWLDGDGRPTGPTAARLVAPLTLLSARAAAGA